MILLCLLGHSLSVLSPIGSPCIPESIRLAYSEVLNVCQLLQPKTLSTVVDSLCSTVNQTLPPIHDRGEPVLRFAAKGAMVISRGDGKIAVDNELQDDSTLTETRASCMKSNISF
jgi:hypothetical protein